MTSRTAVVEETGPTRSPSRDDPANWLGPLTLLVLSAWCGIVAGLLEVGVTVLRKQVVDLNHL
jgi:hypothetical protein